MHEGLHHLGIVVHSLEQHALVAERDAGEAESITGVAQLGGGFLGVVDVDAHPDRTVLLEDLAERRRDPLRQEDGNAGADANELHVLDRPQPAEQMLQLLVREEQRIAARQEHVANLRVGFDGPQTLFVLRVKVVVLRVGHEPAARAVAAVGRAAVGHQKEHAIRVAVN